MKKHLALLIGLPLIFGSCSQEDEIDTNLNYSNKIMSLNSEEIDYNYISDDMVKGLNYILAESLQDEEARIEISSIIDNLDDYGDAASFAFIFNDISNFTEFENLESMSNHNLIVSTKFRQAINKSYVNNKELFQELANEVESIDQTSNSLTKFERFLIKNKLELFFPYKENFKWEGIEEYTVSFEKENKEDDNDGLLYTPYDSYSVTTIDDEYVYENPTVAIVPLDDEYTGTMVKLYLDDESYIINPNQPIEKLDEIYHKIFNNSYNPIRQKLDFNVQPNSTFGDKNLISTYIPEVMLDNLGWKRTLSKSHRSRLAKVGSTTSINPDGTFNAIGNVIYYRFDFSKKDIRGKKWKTVNLNFDLDWDKVKASQQIVFWTLRKNGNKSTEKFNVGFSLDSEGKFNPNVSYSQEIEATSGSRAILRGNEELYRRQVLSTVVGGTDFGNTVRLVNGTNYSVRNIDSHFKYYFGFYYTPILD